MNTLNKIDRRLPYRTSDAEFEVMAERIRLRTTARTEQVAQPVRRTRVQLQWAVAMAVVAVAFIVGLSFVSVEPEPQPTLAELLATASPETLREVAEMNYDDIIFNQQI